MLWYLLQENMLVRQKQNEKVYNKTQPTNQDTLFLSIFATKLKYDNQNRKQKQFLQGIALYIICFHDIN